MTKNKGESMWVKKKLILESWIKHNSKEGYLKQLNLKIIKETQIIESITRAVVLRVQLRVS